jgi:hypothetical protein
MRVCIWQVTSNLRRMCFPTAANADHVFYHGCSSNTANNPGIKLDAAFALREPRKLMQFWEELTEEATLNSNFRENRGATKYSCCCDPDALVRRTHRDT